MVGEGPLGHTRQVRRPRNLRKEAKGLRDVRLDLQALARREAPLRDRKQRDFLGLDGRPQAARRITVEDLADPGDLGVHLFGQHGRGVGPFDDPPGALDLRPPRGKRSGDLTLAPVPPGRLLPDLRGGREERLVQAAPDQVPDTRRELAAP